MNNKNIIKCREMLRRIVPSMVVLILTLKVQKKDKDIVLTGIPITPNICAITIMQSTWAA